MKTNGYESAFPFQEIGGMVQPCYGLTKREYFAAMAMQGLSADLSMKTDMIPEVSVKLADALIAELNKPKTDE